MALTPDEQKKLNQLIQEGIKLAKQLNDTQQASSFQNFTGSLSDAERIVKSLRQDWADYISDIGGAREGFSRIVDEMKNMNSGLGKSKSAFSDLSSLAAKLQSHQQGISTLSVKELQNLKKKVAEKVNDLELSKKLISDEIDALKLKSSLSVSEQSRLDKLNNAQEEINNELGKQGVYINQFNAQLDEQIKLEEQINAKLGLTGKLMKGISQVPLVGQFVDADKALGKMRDTAKDGGSKIAVLGAGFKSIGGDIAKGIMDPLFLVTQLVKMFIDVDKQAGEFAKSQNISYKDSLKMREEYAAMAASSGDMSLNARAFMETQSAISTSLGTNAKLNKADLDTFTKLREKAGLTNDELVSIQKVSLVNGKTLEQNSSEILGGAKAYAMRNKLVINEKQVLKDVSKASSALTLSLGGSLKAVAESVVKAKQFGLTLEQAEKMSSGLLNFEQSIEDELSAELLLGKDLNFERARGLALNGDIAGASAEIASQVGSAADFGKMNVIQQDAIAKSIGLSREELAKSLVEREALAKIGFKDAEAAKAEYETMRKTMTAEEAAAELGDKQLALQFEQQSNAEKFAQTIEHVKEMFVSIVDGPMGTILNMLGSMLKNAGFVYTIFGLISALMAGNMLIGLGKMIAQLGIALGLSSARAIAEVTAAEALTLGAATVAIVGGLAAVGGLMYSMMKGDDIMSPAQGGAGYGKRTLMGPEGAIQLNDKDTVIAGTNLFGNDVKSEPGKATQMGGKGEIKLGGDSSAVVNAIMELRKDVNALANRPISVAIDGKKVIEATTGAQPNTQGDENRKNSYKMS
jgi:hypothetical protein